MGIEKKAYKTHDWIFCLKIPIYHQGNLKKMSKPYR